jgi:phosphoserine aminotransferase
MSTKRIFNFSAGPSTLPTAVVDGIQSGMTDFGGMSILEISHRSAGFTAVIDEARGLVRELMDIPKDYEVLFMQGGASHQFAMIPLNFMERSADYLLTGVWSKKALAEAEIVGATRVAYTSEDSNFSRTPGTDEVEINRDADYVHITSNNTIFGTQYATFPETGTVPLMADMSSDIMSRVIDVSKFGLIYAGAQKNLGPAGVTIVIIRKDLLNNAQRFTNNVGSIPKILRYSTHVESKSLYNTPPTFPIWALMQNLRWLKGQGGVAGIEGINSKKAAMIYDVVDGTDFFTGNAETNSRSIMNVTFTLPTDELSAKFLAEAQASEMSGLKGHRSVGGIRASIYNAMPTEGVERLVEFMKEFERKNA